MLNDEIKKYLDNLSKEINPLQSFHGEIEIAEEIKNILKKEDVSYKPSDEDIAEQMAFGFLADCPNDNSGWGTYYDPIFVLPNKQGQMVEYPSIQKVTKETLIY
jgi:hypothetical protein